MNMPSEVLYRILTDREAEIASLELLNSEMLARLKESSRLLACYARLMDDAGDSRQAEAIRDHLRKNVAVVKKADHRVLCKSIDR